MEKCFLDGGRLSPACRAHRRRDRGAGPRPSRRSPAVSSPHARHRRDRHRPPPAPRAGRPASAGRRTRGAGNSPTTHIWPISTPALNPKRVRRSLPSEWPSYHSRAKKETSAARVSEKASPMSRIGAMSGHASARVRWPPTREDERRGTRTGTRRSTWTNVEDVQEDEHVHVLVGRPRARARPSWSSSSSCPCAYLDVRPRAAPARVPSRSRTNRHIFKRSSRRTRARPATRTPPSRSPSIPRPAPPAGRPASAGRRTRGAGTGRPRTSGRSRRPR